MPMARQYPPQSELHFRKFFFNYFLSFFSFLVQGYPIHPAIKQQQQPASSFAQKLPDPEPEYTKKVIANCFCSFFLSLFVYLCKYIACRT